MNKFIRVIDNETIEIREYKTPDAVFQTNEYYSNDLYCIIKEVVNPFEMYQENQQLKSILTELEEWLKEETIELYDKDNSMLLDQSYITYATERKMAYMFILDKIQELKEKYK